MRDFLRSIHFKILMALLTVMLGFMIMSVYTGGTAPLFSQIISVIIMPVQRFSAGASNSVTEFFDKYMRSAEVYEKNKLMQEEINALRSQMIDYEKVKHENEQFRQIIGVMENRQDLTFKTASIIERDPQGRFGGFKIDKGSLDGVKYLDPVMTAEGLVGYVSEVGLAYAKVATILDVAVDVGVYDNATRDIGVVSGSVDLAAKSLCRMDFLLRESEISPGNIILTSGGSLFPKDIIVGKVLSVAPNASGTGLSAVIQPAADIMMIKDVFVITEFEGQGR